MFDLDKALNDVAAHNELPREVCRPDPDEFMADRLTMTDEERGKKWLGNWSKSFHEVMNTLADLKGDAKDLKHDPS